MKYSALGAGIMLEQKYLPLERAENVSGVWENDQTCL